MKVMSFILDQWFDPLSPLFYLRYETKDTNYINFYIGGNLFRSLSYFVFEILEGQLLIAKSIVPKALIYYNGAAMRSEKCDRFILKRVLHLQNPMVMLSTGFAHYWCEQRHHTFCRQQEPNFFACDNGTSLHYSANCLVYIERWKECPKLSLYRHAYYIESIIKEIATAAMNLRLNLISQGSLGLDQDHQIVHKKYISSRCVL
ncbi:hypothetical protein BDF20DRAFT_838434 [Mycotypha africana]|uniref:uncharacterized protein n=1 Tax=Mycotypha africana TaxID=64632 RepID=UPI00230130C5|nr:uncharacterized protein BDF20DRAFT_838434 [Mycotypha africana]KAI8970034.1 hypothetical protein BDF20DRAFT_838434 [Mycotypha africana]